ncbi:MAG: DEAD/DEAH box helicase [Pirellulales bacterium]
MSESELETTVSENETATVSEVIEETTEIQAEATTEAEVVTDAEVKVEAEVVTEEEVKTEVEAPKNDFASLGLNKALVAAVESQGYTTPTPIQAETIPLLLDGRDVLGQAQTGTGKTAAFALPALQRIDPSKKNPQVLVLTPTRELAIQVADAFAKYATKSRNLKIVPIYGGQDYQIQFRAINKGAQIIVGTPGRVMDHMRRGSLNLKELQCFVLDEADEMLNMGFEEDVKWVLSQIPGQRQMALFSATMPPAIRQIAQKHLNNPAEITIKQKTATADTINQRYVIAPPRQKQAVLARILEAEPTEGVLVFVKMRSTTEPVADFLAQAGMKTAALNGDIPQKQRERIVEKLRSGKIDVIVATDVAARGLDVKRISHVINYDLPHDSEAYVHRIGRTGRAGRSGEAIMFINPRERHLLKRLEHATRNTIEQMELPSNRDINLQRVAQFHEKISVAMACKEIETFESIVEHYRRDNDVPLEKIAAALAVLANQESPLIVKNEIKQASFDNGSGRGNSRDGRSRSQGRDFKSDRKPGRNRNEPGMQTYRVEVGRSHEVQAGNIVGAIANEAGIGRKSIGKINIFDRFSTVDLPEGMSSTLIGTIKNIVVSGQKLELAPMSNSSSGSSSSGSGYSGGRSQGGKRPFNKSKFKTKQRKKGSTAK